MHVILLDQLRGHVLAVVAAGGEVDLEEVLEDFETRLNEEPSEVNWERQQLLADLGIRG